MAKTDSPSVTRERLLSEAESRFAEKGYEAVSVREITTAAECNLAAVNYHFGSKKNLYLEVFRERWIPRARRIHAAFRESLNAEEGSSPADVVEALARAFLEGPLTDEERSRHHQLIAREMAKPSGAFELLAREAMQPFFMEVAGLLHQDGFGSPPVPKEDLFLDILSMMAIVLYYNFARNAVTRMTGKPYDEAFRKRLVEHIIRYSLNGMGLQAPARSETGREGKPMERNG